jgi:hypothetical protein
MRTRTRLYILCIRGHHHIRIRRLCHHIRGHHIRGHHIRIHRG